MLTDCGQTSAGAVVCWYWVGVAQHLGRKHMILVTCPSVSLILAGTVPDFPFSGWEELDHLSPGHLTDPMAVVLADHEPC